MGDRVMELRATFEEEWLVAEARSSYPSMPLTHRDLKVYRRAFELAGEVSRLERLFPKEELYCLVPQIRRAARSVHANIAEAWRKRRYEGAFIAKPSDAEAEAAETQSWLETALDEGYIDAPTFDRLFQEYEHLLASIVGMIHYSENGP
ncbi:MAG TPA: four helix bundle protein [Fimbriimonadaceae bacterium]|nr:four helix bundle protein [Fimbriimonadaceae bacterium]